jgi:hypothetical protein
MDRTACTEPQCLYKGDLYLFSLPDRIPFTNVLLEEALCLELTLDVIHTHKEVRKALHIMLLETLVTMNFVKTRQAFTSDNKCFDMPPSA